MERFFDAFLDGNGRDDDYKVCKTVFFMQFIDRVDKGKGFAGAGFHVGVEHEVRLAGKRLSRSNVVALLYFVQVVFQRAIKIGPKEIYWFIAGQRIRLW